jgi:hypothetical protein
VAIVVIVALVAMLVVGADYEINPNVLYAVNGIECCR